MKNIQSNQDVFCHSYDLSGRLNDQMDVIEMSRIFQIVSSPLVANPVLHERQHGLQFYQNLILQLEGIFSTKSNCVVRVLFYRPTNIPVFTVALPMFMSYVRSRKLPVVVMVSVQPWTCTASTIPLQRCCDAVLLVESFASRREYPPPAEFRMLNGLLHIKKVSTVTTSLGHFADFTVTKRPAAYLFGLKRDRRKLHIQLLHIPPEDYAAGGGSVGGGGVRSGAGRSSSSNSIPSRTTTTKATTTGFGCASNVGSGNSPMDF